jgi:hypothetical protein
MRLVTTDCSSLVASIVSSATSPEVFIDSTAMNGANGFGNLTVTVRRALSALMDVILGNH